MGIYFRKRIKILPGIHLNVSKTGTSWTLGGRGASVNVGKKGVYANAGIPGTGIYSRTKLSGNKPNRSAIRREKENEVINRNPLRFILVFLFLWLSVMIPIMSNASWIWFPILAFVGICCAFIPDRKGKDYEFEIQPTQKQSGVKMEEITHDSGKVEEMTDKSVGVDEPIKESSCAVDMNRLDPIFEEAARLVVNAQLGSTSLIQRKFSIGYNRAGRIVDQLECAKIIAHASGSKPRDVLCKDEKELEILLNNLSNEQFDSILEEHEEENDLLCTQVEYEKTSRLISMGIGLEKEGMIDEAISVYEKSIMPKLPTKHPYERLAILYRKRKDYENEIRVLKIAIDVFMKDNERRAGRVIEGNDSMYEKVMQALETNESIKYEDGRWAFVQYDVMGYITRLEKARKLLKKRIVD